MNREIKFRGQRVDTKEWVYGYYYTDTAFNGFSEENEELYTKSFIRKIKGTFDGLFLAVEVIPETVGLFAGLKDINDVEIYKSDIMAIDLGQDGIDYHLVRFENGSFFTGTNNLENLKAELDYWGDRIYVAGNIHETPELLTKNEE